MHEHLVLQCGLHVDDCRQRLVVDLDRLERVRGGVAVAGDDDRDRVADVPHLVDGERRVGGQLHVLGHRPRARQEPCSSAKSAPLKAAITPGLLQRR